MEMNPETFKKFQELTMSGKVNIDNDTIEQSNQRMDALIVAGVVPSLVAIATKGEGELTLEQISVCFMNMASMTHHRGTIAAQGGIGCLLKVIKKGNEKSKSNASHALARILISINPMLLSDGQRMDCIVPLKQLLEAPHELPQVNISYDINILLYSQQIDII